MKVSEAIDQLKVGDTVWMKGKVLDFDDTNPPLYVQVGIGGYKWLHEEDEISLSEPKEVVSQEFADWVEKSMMWKHDGSWAAKEIAGYGWGAFMHDPATEEELLPKKYPWVEAVQNNKEKHIKAIYDGYTVEQPKRWVVRQGGSEVWYLQGFRNSLDGDIVKQWCSHEGCIKFTDRAKAEAVATLVEGSVEEID